MAEQDYVRLAAACHCGEPVKLWSGRGRKPKFCEGHPAKQKPPKLPITKECPACRGFFVPAAKGGPEQKFCSRDCGRRYRKGNKPKQLWALTCCVCTGGFESFSSSAIYCSNTCKAKAWARANHEKSRAGNRQPKKKFSVYYAGYCAWCGDAFGAKRKRKHCSKRCESSAWHAANPVSIAPAIKECRECKAMFSPADAASMHSAYCSPPCVKASKSRSRRVWKLARKARLRGVWVERVDPLKVFDRDKWLCKLCGIKTPKVKRGTYDDDAPELDHIIPLAQGGEHSYRNTQCACRRCNGAKGDRPLGQMLLIG